MWKILIVSICFILGGCNSGITESSNCKIDVKYGKDLIIIPTGTYICGIRTTEAGAYVSASLLKIIVEQQKPSKLQVNNILKGD